MAGLLAASMAARNFPEYIAASRYYDHQVPGLGGAFVDAVVEAGVGRILAAPRSLRVKS